MSPEFNQYAPGAAPNLPPRPESLIENLAAEAYRSSEARSLTAVLAKRIDESNVFDFIACGNLQLQNMASKKIGELLQRKPFQQALETHLSTPSDSNYALLVALSALPVPQSPALFRVLMQHASSAEPKMRAAAARVIAFAYPDDAHLLLPLLALERPEMLVDAICLSRNEALLWPLLRHFDFPAADKLPSTVGFLVSPQWLVRHYRSQNETVTLLARRFGYVEDEVTDHSLELWRRGIMFSSRALAGLTIADIESLISEYDRFFLAHHLRMKPPAAVFDPGDAVQLGALLATVRAYDRTILDARRGERVFQDLSRRTIPVVFFQNRSYSECCDALIQQGRKVACAAEIPERDHGLFLLDRAAVLLEAKEDCRTEASYFLHAKWKALSRLPDVDPATVCFPLAGEQECPLLKFAVLDPGRCIELRSAPQLSKGADAAGRLQQYLGYPGTMDALAAMERFYREFLQPVGCEVQVPLTWKHRPLILAWKEALQYFSIGSPRRLEYEKLVEAAMRPAHTFHSPILTTIFLFQLGFMPEETELALHISLQGALRENVRYLAFPMQLTSRPRADQLDEADLYRRITRVMSKGMVNLNGDTESCRAGDLKPRCRTEIRTSRISMENRDGQLILPATFVEDIASTQLLGSACVSSEPALRAEWQRYAEGVEECLKAYPSEVADLLHADWYEHTGDPVDPKLVALLPIVQLRLKARAALNAHELGPRLREDLYTIRHRSALAVHQVLRSTPTYPFPELGGGFLGEIELLLPRELLEGLWQGAFRRIWQDY